MSPSSSAKADDPVIVVPLSKITVRVYWVPAFAGMTLKRLRVD